MDEFAGDYPAGGPSPFRAVFAELEQQLAYWVEGAKLAFAMAVERRMAELGVSKAELARRLETTPSHVTKMLNGRHNFTLESMVRVARALGCELRPVLAPPPAPAASLALAADAPPLFLGDDSGFLRVAEPEH